MQPETNMPWMQERPLISVAIYLKGHRLDPDHVSQVLGIQPSRSQKKGGFRAESTKFIAKIGMWTHKIKSDSRLISDLIDELLKQIGNPPTPLNEIDGVEDAHLDILFALDGDDGAKETVEFALTKNQIARLSQLGLSACVTVM